MKETELTAHELEMVLGCREKNHIDNECCLQLPPEMSRFFKDGESKQLLSVFRESDNISFEEVSKYRCRGRLLTQEEYDVFPEESKTSKGLFKQAFLNSAVFLIIGILLLYFSTVTIATMSDLSEERSLFVLLALGFAFVGIFSMTFTSNRDYMEIRQIRRNSEAAFGKVLFFRKKAAERDVYGSTDTYLIDVAFYDEEAYVKDIVVPKHVWDKLEQGTEVCLYNGRLTMYRNKGKPVYVKD